jgi:hypothetical protein
MTQRKKDVLLGAMLVIGFSLMLLVFIPRGIDVPNGIRIAATAPDYWPKLISAVTVLLGLVLLSQGIRQILRDRHSHAGGKSAADARIRRVGFFRTAAALAGLLLYYLLVEPLGIVLSSMLALPFFAVIYGERRLKVLIPLALLLPAALYVFFTKVANIPMPLGIFA